MNFLNLTLTVISMSLITPFSSVHAQANGGRGGGDDTNIAREHIEDYITSPAKLKTAFSKLLRVIDFEDIDDPSLKRDLQRMMKEGLLKDIQGSVYKPEAHCYDDAGVEHAASTLQGIRGSEICFNLSFLMKPDYKASSEIMGLVAHEHARHFSISDTVNDPIRGDNVHPIGFFISEQARAHKKLDQSAGFKEDECSHQSNQCSLYVIQEAIRCIEKDPSPTWQDLCMVVKVNHNKQCIQTAIQCSLQAW